MMPASYNSLSSLIRAAELFEKPRASGEAAWAVQGVVHEWFAVDQPCPPLQWMLHAAGQSLTEAGPDKWILWIGRWCWPYPPAMELGGGRLLDRSIFVDPPDRCGRLWAIEVACRSEAVAVVVADGRGLKMSETRRLQLAARAGDVAVMLGREDRELRELSAAAMRWTVRPVPTDGERPRWEVRLVRCKGWRQNIGMEAPAWFGDWSHEAGLITVSADVADAESSSPVPGGADQPVRNAG